MTQHNKLNLFRGFCLFVVFPALIYAVTQLRSCGSQQKPAFANYTNAGSTVEHIYDTIPHVFVRDSLIPGQSFTLEIPASIDTAAIISAYFQAHTYQDTITDSNLVAIHGFTIAQNQLKSYTFNYRLLNPVQTIITTTLIAPPKPRDFFLGMNAGYFINNQKIGIGPHVFLTHKRRAYGLGYDLVNKNVQLNFLIKL